MTVTSPRFPCGAIGCCDVPLPYLRIMKRTYLFPFHQKEDGAGAGVGWANVGNVMSWYRHGYDLDGLKKLVLAFDTK